MDYGHSYGLYKYVDYIIRWMEITKIAPNCFKIIGIHLLFLLNTLIFSSSF